MIPSPLLGELLAMGVLFNRMLLVTASRALTANDNGSTLVYAGSSPITLTAPSSGLPTDFFCTVKQQGAGAISFAATGGTIVAAGPVQSTNGAGSAIDIHRVDTTSSFVVTSSHVSGAELDPLVFVAPALAASTGKGTLMATRPGTYGHAYGRLSAALTGSTVITVKKNGAAVATLTFASGSQSPTVAWTSGSNFSVAAGDYLTFDATVGTGGPADLSFGFDL